MARGQNLLSKVYNKPLLITLDELQPIADYLSNPDRVASLKIEQENSTAPKLESFQNESQYNKALLKHLDINPETMTGVLHIDGVLVNREGSMNSQCVELTSYQGLKKKFEMQVEQGIKSCVLMISSGGGEAFGAWSTATYIKKLAKENNIKLTSYINGNACSAAYVWAVVADEIVSHPMGSSGSIGVVVQLYNDSKMLEKAGVERSFVYAGGNKIPFDKEGNFTEKFVSDLQNDVDKTYMRFVNHVVSNTNLSESQVIATNASVFSADDSLELGLINKIMELEDFEVEYGLKSSKSNGNGVLLKTPEHKKLLTQEGTMSELNADQLQTQLSVALKDKETLTSQLTTATEQLETFQAELKELNTLKDSMEAQLTELAQAKELLEQEKVKAELDAKVLARTAKLEDALGKDSEKVDSLLQSTESLSDEQFDIIATSLASTQEAKQEQFNEKGGEGDVSTTQLSLSEKLAAKAQAMQSKKTV